MYNCLKIHQPNIIKITNKDYKRNRERYQSISRKEKRN